MKHGFVLACVCLATSFAYADSTTLSHTRVSLVSLSVTGYDALKDDKSFLEIGVATVPTADGMACEILDPRPKTAAAKQVWAPFDFYTNILNEEQQTEVVNEGRLGEADLFFMGDNNNRNRAKHSHKWTRLVADNFRGSLDFKEGERKKDWFSFLIHFTRGAIHYSTLVSPRAWVEKGACKAAAFSCTKTYLAKDGHTLCEPDGWTRQVMEVLAEADIKGALSDSFFRVSKEKEKNDVSSVSLVFQDLDSDGKPVGKPYAEKVASK